MPDQAEPQPIGGLALSVQDQGETFGLHIEMPGTQFAVKFPIEYAQQLKAQFPEMLDAVIADANRQKSGIITPPSPSGKLEIVKG